MAGKPQTVLVVEDEASIASFVAAYLKNAGYTVRTTASGTEALKLVASEKPALVVLDLMLPDIDGVEVCKQIRATGDLPVLMLTARDEDVDKIIGLEVGADDYMTKPFNPRELVARVRAILRRSAPDRAKRESAVSVTVISRSTQAGVKHGSESRKSSWRQRSSICCGSCSTTAALSSLAISYSSGSGATRSRAIRARLTCTCASCAASSATHRRSSRCGASATR